MSADKKEAIRLSCVADFLEEQKDISASANKFKLHFTLEALRIALDEASGHLSTDLDWIWEGMYEALQSKCETAKDNYILGFFIYALTLQGAQDEAAKNTVADWTHCAERKCGMALEEIKTLVGVERSSVWFDWERAGKQDLLSFISRMEAERPFPEGNADVLEAYTKLKAQISSDPLKEEGLSTGITAAQKQFISNKRYNRLLLSKSEMPL